MSALRIIFGLISLLIVGADAVLLGYARSFHDSLEERLRAEAADEAKQSLIQAEERRSWREYEPYVVPLDAVAAQIVLVRSPLAALETPVRSRFSLYWDGTGETRMRSPWFSDGVGAIDPDDPDAAEKRRRLGRLKALEPAIIDAFDHSPVRRAITYPRDACSAEVVRCQAEPARAAAEIAEAQRGNAQVQEKLKLDWDKSQAANRSAKRQQYWGQSMASQSQQAQSAPSPQDAQGARPAGRIPARARVDEPASSPPAYDVRVTSFHAIRVPDPERNGRPATFYIRKVAFFGDDMIDGYGLGSAGPGLPSVGPYFQAFEVDDAGLPAAFALSSSTSLRSTRLLLNGAAALIFILGTGGLYMLYGAVASRLELARRRTEFTAAVSHELKAPLAGIRALAEMMHEGIVTAPEKCKEYVGNILHESERLSRLIANVLDMARLERRERTYSTPAADPAPAIREAVEIFRTHLVGRGFAVTIDVPEALPPVLHDRDALVQTLANLIDNAAKYTAPCPVRRVAVRAIARQREVAIEVEDSGIGIPPEDRTRIFEPYRRGRDPLARGTGGAGLGLPIARSHVGAMGGRIEVESEKGKGSLFRVVLQVSEGPA